MNIDKKYKTTDLLRMLRGMSTDTVPPGWYSSATIMAAAKVSRGHIHRILCTMRESGLILDTKSYKVTCPARGPYPIPHYKLTKEACKALGLKPPN